MLLENLNALRNPSSQGTLELTDELIIEGHIYSGLLYCETSKVAIPIVHGYPLFGEAKPWSNPSSAQEWISDLERTKFSKESNYIKFLEEKSRRGSSDAYAAFQPFNESTRALYPFIPILKEALKPGDIILDTWCRTGWSGELLAGLFPEQRVISLWEGDSNVLGYRGFDYWLDSTKRHPNLDIIFTHPDKPLPFATDSIRMIHGLDSLHRYEKEVFLTECLRVCENDGLLIFPHIHLTNSEPEPFFERGCQQYHGSEWKERVDAAVLASERKCWILPEVELYDSNFSLKLKDDSETHHYNALLLIASNEIDGSDLGLSKYLPLTSDFRLIENPLFNIDLNQGQVSINNDRLGGFAPEMLTRHPCYDQHISNIKQSQLSNDEIRLLWQAQNGLTLGTIAKNMELSLDRIFQLTEALSKREIVHAAPISKAMWGLQNFYSFVRLPPKEINNFLDIWQDLTRQYQSQSIVHWLLDGSELMLDDVNFLVDATRAALRKLDIDATTRIGLASGHHPAALILCWACWLEGICVVLLDENQSKEKLHSLCRNCDAHWLFTDNPMLLDEEDDKSVLFDNAEDYAALSEKHNLFSTLLESYDGEAIACSKINPKTDAVILFSSGSSGESKRIVLSQEALCISGLNMASTFNWQNEKILSLGPFSMMSGMRNPMVASLISGSTIVLASKEMLMPINAWQQAQDHDITVITTVPSWLEILLSTGRRLSTKGNLRQVLVTGSQLKSHVREEFTSSTEISIENYYGLTETGGLCLATCNFDIDYASIGQGENCIGLPVGALVHIVDNEGHLLGLNQTGLLKIYSNQLMDRYLDDPNSTNQVTDNGWFLTGDLAYRDSQGRIFLQGRNDDMIKLRDGSWLHPNKLEQLLSKHPEVQDAAVLITDPYSSLIGLIVTKEEPERILNTLKKQHLNERLPDKLKRVTSLPYNRNGKLQRSLLPDFVGKD